MSADDQDRGTITTGGSLTLDRGLKLLALVAAENRDLTVAELAASLGMHRQAVYRLLATLRAHQLVAEGSSGRYRLGLGIMKLARQVHPQLRRTAIPFLRRLAQELDATAQCVVAEGEEAVVLAVVEPPDSDFHLSQRSGARHALDQGASGWAILMTRPPTPSDPRIVQAAREAGFAVSRGRLTTGAIGIAVPLYDSNGNPLEASIGVISMSDLDVALASQRLLQTAELIAKQGT